MKLEPITEAGEPAWDDYVARHPHASLYHRAAWRALVAKVFGHDTPYLVARADDGAIRGVLPAVHIRSRLFGNYMVSLPYFTYGGPLADSGDTQRELMDAAGALAARRGARHVEFRCQQQLDYAGPVRTDKVSMHLPLEPTTEKMWSALSSQRRSQVRKAEKAGVTVQRGGIELLDEFYAVFARNMRDLGTPVYSKRLFAEVLRTFPAESLLVVARREGRAAGAAVLLQHPGAMEVPWVSTLREHNSVYANTLLYWELLRVAVERGCPVFDFGRSSLDSGTFQFKKQWGAQPVQLHWHYWLAPGAALPGLTPTNPRFALAIRAWQRLPVAFANLIGPMVVKDLP